MSPHRMPAAGSAIVDMLYTNCINGLGRRLFQLQLGEQLGMPHLRPMPSVAAGVSELRVQGEDGVYRAFYFNLSPVGILVIHAFVKKTRYTPAPDIEIARKRLKEVLDV